MNLIAMTLRLSLAIIVIQAHAGPIKQRRWMKLTSGCGRIDLPENLLRSCGENVDLPDAKKEAIFKVLFSGKKGTKPPEMRVAVSGSFTGPHKHEVFVIAYLYADLSMAEGQGYFGYALLRDNQITPMEIEGMPFGLWGSSEIQAVDLDKDGTTEILFHREAMHQTTYGYFSIYSLKNLNPRLLQSFDTYFSDPKLDPQTEDIVDQEKCWEVYWNGGPLSDPKSFKKR
ncbi:MAG: hypothetical protein P4L51_20555 [Puia sp.]|nr:hypothetical protein [Puia sp.]